MQGGAIRQYVWVVEDPYPFLRNVESPITDEMVRPLDPRCEVVQFASMLTDADFQRLASFLRSYPEITLRAYGSYDGSIRNLDFLRHFPDLKHFQADALYNSLENIEGLGYLRHDLVWLGLGQTKRRMSLAPLARFHDLRGLYLEGQTQDIEVVSSLVELRRVTLRSITLPDLTILGPLTRLRALDLKLGGTRNLSLLPSFANLVYIEVWMVRGFADLDPVASVPSLEMLFLQSLKNVTEIPALNHMSHLTTVHLETMKGIRDLRPLLTAPVLENVILIDMGHLQPADVGVLAEHPTLKTASIGLGSLKKNAAAAELLRLPRGTYARHPALTDWS